MKELEKLLKIDTLDMLHPGTQGKNFIELRCYCDFEGHGRASEMWEKHWELVLPMQQAHWKSTKGWKPCKKGLRQKFHGKTFDEVVGRAKASIKEMAVKEQNERVNQ